MWIAWVVAVLLQISSSASSPTGSGDEGKVRNLEAAVAELTRSQQVFQMTMLRKMEDLMFACQAGGPITPLEPVTLPVICKANEEFAPCGESPCFATCEYKDGPSGCIPTERCNTNGGCQCQNGYVRKETGECVIPDQCPGPATCPSSQPDFDDPCPGPMSCFYGEECCCGECHSSLRMECQNGGGRWLALFTEACFARQCGSGPEYIVLALGGQGDASVELEGVSCDAGIPDVPQPYGEEGRIGSYSTYWDDNVMVCGGYSGSGPPFSTFRDCQILDLNTKSWREGPELMNLTAKRSSVNYGNKFYIFGGSYPSNPGPGPTVWREHNVIQVLDLSDLESGWKIIDEAPITSPTTTSETTATTTSTRVTVPARYFQGCFT